MATTYHWKHGWIPLDHEAALSKAHGDHAAASKMLSDAHGSGAGIKSRRDVAGAIRDLPNVSKSSDREDARRQIDAAAKRHGAADLIPRKGTFYHGPKSANASNEPSRKSGSREPVNHGSFYHGSKSRNSSN